MGVKNRGFASLSKERRQELAKKGGEAARDKGVAHKWSPEQARAARSKGMETRLANRHLRNQE